MSDVRLAGGEVKDSSLLGPGDLVRLEGGETVDFGSLDNPEEGWGEGVELRLQDGTTQQALNV